MIKPLLATAAFALGIGGLLLAGGTRPFAAVPAPSPTPVSSALVPGGPLPLGPGTTTVDCGPGRRALVQQANGATSVQCADAAVAVDGVASGPLLVSAPQDSLLAPQALVAPQRVAPSRRLVSYEEPRPSRVVRRGRSWKKSAAIIGGSTAAGAGVGAVLGGGSGAKKGAVVGLLGGTVYDLATRGR
jgi:hypothetical protein